MDKVTEEILLITQEECAEVTQAISKVFRFGIDAEHKGVTNLEHLEEEVGDLLCMIDLLVERNIVRYGKVKNAQRKKLEKLKQWSSIGETP